MSIIAVIGLGYVGLSNAILLSRKNHVIAVDISQERVNLVNHKKTPIADDLAEKILSSEPLNLEATTDSTYAYRSVEWLIIATPTNYDSESRFFNTDTVQRVIEESIKINPRLKIIIKSTIPVGFVNEMREKFDYKHIYFSPEFLREGKALYDNLYPSRIVVGDDSDIGEEFSQILLDAAEKKNVPILLTSTIEAEAIKLFANTYLAMRVAFFNELDSYAMYHSLDSKDIITGICYDPRIGDFYNNPSFGYGGYCLPKDSKQLLANFKDVPNNVIKAIVDGNDTRKTFIADAIMQTGAKSIGVYRLIMKAGSDNFRESSVLDVAHILMAKGLDVYCYEPLLDQKSFEGISIIDSLVKFKESVNLIISNRYDDSLNDVKEKVFCRDIFRVN